MKLHRNAKTTPHMRALLVDRVRVPHWSAAAAADAAGVSLRTAYKWRARQRAGGRAALEDRASTPHRQPRGRPAQVEATSRPARPVTRGGDRRPLANSCSTSRRFWRGTDDRMAPRGPAAGAR